MAKVKKVEELSPVEINRDITKVSNIIKKTQNPRMRDVITAGKQVEIGGRAGHINRIQDGSVYVEMLDNPGEIERFDIKKALKNYKPEKAKEIVANTALAGPANGSVAKEPKVSKGLVGLKMEKLEDFNEELKSKEDSVEMNENSFNHYMDTFKKIKSFLQELETRKDEHNKAAKPLNTGEKDKINYYNGKIEEDQFIIQKLKSLLGVDKMENPAYNKA